MTGYNMSTSHTKEWSWKYVLLFAGLIFLWAIENFILQASAFWVPPVTRHPYLYQGIRLVLNLLAAAIVLLIFNRFWLIFIAIMDCLLSLVIAAYNQHFHQALSANYAIKTVKEGLRVTGFSAQVIPPFVWALLICAALTSPITYAGRSPNNGSQPHSSRQIIFWRRRGLTRL